MARRLVFGRAGKRATRALLGAALVGAGTLSLIGGTVTPAGAAPGDLDASFGSGGIVVDGASKSIQANSVVLQPDGSIVLAGSAANKANSFESFSIARLTPGGAADGSFNGGNPAQPSFGSQTNDVANGVVPYPGGRFLAVGSTTASPDGNQTVIAVARLNNDGSTDGSFGSGLHTTWASAGCVSTPCAISPTPGTVALQVVPSSNSHDAGFGAVIDAAGGAEVVAVSGTPNKVVVARLNANGSLDTSFGNDSGVLVTTIATSTPQPAIVLGPPGTAYVSGAVKNSAKASCPSSFGGGGCDDIGLARVTIGAGAGVLDGSFGTSGLAKASASGDDQANGLAVAPDGGVIVVGSATYGSPSAAPREFLLAKFTSGGAADGSFGNAGLVTTNFYGADDEARAVAVRADGRLAVTGIAENTANGCTPPACFDSVSVAQYASNGSLDPSFGSGGKTVTSFGPASNQGLALAIQPDTKIVVAGKPSISRPGLAALRLLTETASVNDAAIVDLTSGAGSMTFNVSLAVASPVSVTVFYSTGDGSAHAGSDYFETSGSLTFAPGQTSQNVTVGVPFGPNPNGDVTFSLNLTGIVNAAILRGQGTGFIHHPGYMLVASDGGIFAFGNPAQFHGSTGSLKLNRPVVGMARTPSGAGYWSVASDGGIFAFGDAGFFGSTGSIHLNQPIVGMASTPSGSGYWLVASDGGIFAFGTGAAFFGSTGAIHLNKPVVGMATTPSGNGYWLVASDGGIFAFGPGAGFFGSTGAIHLNKPIVGMASTPSGNGYWLVASDGGIFAFGDAGFFGSTGSIHLNQPIVGMAPTPTGVGYWLVASDGGIFAFGDGPFYGSTGSIKLNMPIVGMSVG